MNEIQIETTSPDMRTVEFGVYPLGANIRIFDNLGDPRGSFLTLAGCVALRDALTDYVDGVVGEPIPYSLTDKATA